MRMAHEQRVHLAKIQQPSRCATMRNLLVVLLALFLGAISTPKSSAQATSGEILGIVQDATGSVIPDATVNVTNIGTTETKTTHTDGAGNYEVLYLIPGKYTVEVSKQGFSTVKRSAFDLQVDQKARIDLRLTVGSTSQTVTVTAAEPLLKTDSSEQGQVIDAEQITTLPLNTRNFAQLLDLTTGAQPNYGDQGGSVNADHPEGVSATNVNGLPSDGNNWQLDGISNNEAFFSVLSVNPSIDAIQEFKATTSDYSAEFGRAGGANVQISIKSGTNAFHGVAFEFIRNSALDANDYFSKQSHSPIPPYKQNQFGGNLGGPIIKGKTFFFADYEGFRNRQGETEIMTIPTLLQRQGIFTETDPTTGASQPTIYQPGTGIPYNNNTITDIDPVSANILKFLPSPNLAGPGGVALLANNYFGKDTLSHSVDQGDVRIDHHLSGANQAFVRYSLLDGTLSQPPFLGNSAGGDPFLAALSHTVNQNAVVSDVHVFSPHLINEARIGIDSVNLNWSPFDTNTDTSTQVGIPGINNFCPFCGGLARISVSGMNAWGHTPYAPTQRHDTVFEFIDNVTMIKGKNTIKVGADISHIRATLFQTSNPVGEFDFDQNMTSKAGSGGIGMASFLTGYYSYASRDAMTDIPSYRTNQLFFFAQDDLRVNDKLTLNLGLRYEIFTAPTERHNNQANFDLATGDLLDACIATSCTGGINTDYGNIEPRVGFSYRVEPKTVIRGGFGQSAYSPGSGGQLGTLANNPPWEQAQAQYPVNPYTPDSNPSDAGNGLNYINAGLGPLPALQARPGASAGHHIAIGSGVFWLDPNLKMTRAYQWNVDVQRTLAQNLLLDVAYVGNVGRDVFVNLPGNYPELDPTTTLSFQERRPYYATNPDLNQFDKRLNGGRTNYNSLQAKLEKRFSNGLSLLGAYTWAKNEQEGLDWVNPDTFLTYKDVTGRDLTQRFVVSYTYQLPVGRGQLLGHNFNPWANAALGGWQIQGITTLRTGFPFSPAMASQLDNGLGNVPNQNGSGKVANPTITKWFDWTAFSQPGDQYGNMRHNNLRGPGGKNWDMSIFKNFYAGDNTSRYLQFRAEFFNVFNNVQFGNPNSYICGGTCGEGTITGLAAGSNPRLIQGALKLYF